MTRFSPDTLTLGDELERLADRYDDVRDRIRQADDDDPQRQRWVRELDDIEQEGAEVRWLIDGDDHGFDGYGPEAEVTVRGLDAGEYAEVNNRTSDANARSTSQGGVPGTGRLIFAARGLVDAPFLGGGHPYIAESLNASVFDDRLTAIAGTGNGDGLPIGVQKWLEDLVNERTVGDRGNWREAARSVSADDASAVPSPDAG